MLEHYENFIDRLVDNLASADHALCSNALQLMNALMRDSIVNGGEDEWPKFVRRLQELGIIGTVESLMRGEVAADLAEPIVQFQNLTKSLRRRWREMHVSADKPEHRRALLQIRAASYQPGGRGSLGLAANEELQGTGMDPNDAASWSRLGFESLNPADDFAQTGLLGLMDLSGYVRTKTDAFQKVLLEQSVLAPDEICPLAKASLQVTLILCDHFGVDQEDALESAGPPYSDGESEKIIQPLLLNWERIHAAALTSFLRIWSTASARQDEFSKIEHLVSVLVGRVCGAAGRKVPTDEVEKHLHDVPLSLLREWQLQDLDRVYEHGWGSELTWVFLAECYRCVC